MFFEAVPGLTWGEFVWASYKDLLALTWKDRKAVSFLSTIHDPDLGEQVTQCQKVGGCYQERQVNCSKLVNDYNRYMGDKDKNDQLATACKEMKQLSWYNHVFIKLLEMAVYNSYVMEETVKAHRNLAGKVIQGVLDFKDDLVSQLIGNVHAPSDQWKGNGHAKKEITADLTQQPGSLMLEIICQRKGRERPSLCSLL